MGPYYREVEKSPGPIPTHLLKPLLASFDKDHYVEDEGDIVFYKKREGITLSEQLFGQKKRASTA
jgi:hypothetical protein